jgi:hypothetical protein
MLSQSEAAAFSLPAIVCSQFAAQSISAHFSQPRTPPQLSMYPPPLSLLCARADRLSRNRRLKLASAQSDHSANLSSMSRRMASCNSVGGEGVSHAHVIKPLPLRLLMSKESERKKNPNDYVAYPVYLMRREPSNVCPPPHPFI